MAVVVGTGVSSSGDSNSLVIVAATMMTVVVAGGSSSSGQLWQWLAVVLALAVARSEVMVVNRRW